MIAGLHVWPEAGGAGDWALLLAIVVSTAAVVMLHLALLRMFAERQESPDISTESAGVRALRELRRRRRV